MRVLRSLRALLSGPLQSHCPACRSSPPQIAQFSSTAPSAASRSFGLPTSSSSSSSGTYTSRGPSASDKFSGPRREDSKDWVKDFGTEQRGPRSAGSPGAIREEAREGGQGDRRVGGDGSRLLGRGHAAGREWQRPAGRGEGGFSSGGRSHRRREGGDDRGGDASRGDASRWAGRGGSEEAQTMGRSLPYRQNGSKPEWEDRRGGGERQFGRQADRPNFQPRRSERMAGDRPGYSNWRQREQGAGRDSFKGRNLFGDRLPRDDPQPAPPRDIPSLHALSAGTLTGSSTSPPPTPTGWAPTKKLTFAAMSGLRALHHADPKLYHRAMLAEKFGISYDAVGRILRSRFEHKKEQAAIREAEAKEAGRGRTGYVEREEDLSPVPAIQRAVAQRDAIRRASDGQ